MDAIIQTKIQQQITNLLLVNILQMLYIFFLTHKQAQIWNANITYVSERRTIIEINKILQLLCKNLPVYSSKNL